ncbi:hypothetical protein P8452_67923 [Trifolium repens]|nr:hypothetical protein P8452_67923 [Trifolium repens]
MTDTTTLFLYYPISILLSFSLSFVFPSLINLFKKNIHSLLNFTTNQFQSHSVSVSGSGLALVTAAATADNKINPVPNILQSAMSNSTTNITEITVSPRIGYVSGDVDGLMSCTESLGLESSNDDGMDVNCDDENENDEIWRRKMMMMKKAESRGNSMRSFPPPLTSLNRNGKPSFYLRPVRKDGRLELTEVRIHRPDILHASRHDGRLTLHLIPDPDQEEDDDDEEEEELVEEEEQEEQEEEVVDGEENRGIPMVVGNSNEGLKRCHEMVNRVHGNHLQMCGISIV